MERLRPEKVTVGNRLRELRGEKTLKEVSECLHVTEMALSLWERGERTPNDDMKVQIARYYNVPVMDIFFAL